MDKNGKIASAALLSAIRNRRGHRPPESNRPGDTVIASYNVHKCIGVDRRFDPERTASVIAEIDAEERMQGQLAEQALQDFEVELGIRTPETTPVASTAKDLGPATDKAVEKQTS